MILVKWTSGAVQMSLVKTKKDDNVMETAGLGSAEQLLYGLFKSSSSCCGPFWSQVLREFPANCCNSGCLEEEAVELHKSVSLDAFGAEFDFSIGIRILQHYLA